MTEAKVAVMDRRQFLSGAIGLGAATALYAPRAPRGLLPAAPRRASHAVPERAVPSSTKTLVLVTLYGGNDGLNTVVPYEDPAYLADRRNIAIAPDKLLPLGDGLGLNSMLPGFKSSWDAGELAIVRGVGYPDPSLSHFQAMDIWQSASTTGDVASGWLGRWLDKTGGNPLQACSVGGQVLPALAGDVHRASAVQDSTYGGSQLPDIDSELLAVYRELQRPRPGASAFADAIGTSGTYMLETSKVFAHALDHERPPVLPKGVEDGDVGTQLDIVSSLIRADLPTQAYAVTQGGYDTHAGEVATQSLLLGQLDAAVKSFFSSLAGHPRAAGTTLVVYTEFGRRVQSNGSGGTDHGTANNVYVIGPSVRGGFYGEQPSLVHLDINGNLVHNVDFRSVYATLLQHVIGVDASPFLGRKWPVLGFV